MAEGDPREALREENRLLRRRVAEQDEDLARSAAAQRLLESLAEGALPGAFLLVDARGRVAYASAVVTGLLGEAVRSRPSPEASGILRRVDARLADDLQRALEGTAGTPHATTVGGKPFLASVAPICPAGPVEGVVVRFVPVS